MIRRLRLENLVLIKEADLELGGGLVVVTGETGAGKTIFAQALGLLLGTPGEKGLVGADGPEAYVEAELDLPHGILEADGIEALGELQPADEPGIVVARRIFQDGRSRSYAWGRAVPRDALAALCEQLIAMSGQFEQRRLASSAHQLELLDAFAGPHQIARRDLTRRLWRELRAAAREADEARSTAAEVAHQQDELEGLVIAVEGLEAESESRLLAERNTLRHATELVTASAEAAELLSPETPDQPGATESIARAVAALSTVANVDPELDQTRVELESATVVLREAVSSIRRYLSSLEVDPARLDQVEADLQAIADAKHRYGCGDLDELLAQAATAIETLDRARVGSPLVRAEQEREVAQARFDASTDELRLERETSAAGFSEAARNELELLRLGEGDLDVRLSTTEAGPTGRDQVEFFLRANAGLAYAPVTATASGGELSRIALALRVASHRRAREATIVFDEIDAGIGGTTAHAVADSLRRLSEHAQVIAITHLPQVASVATSHLRVEKVDGDPTHTTITVLGADERQDELERMLGGSEFLSAVSGDGSSSRA